MPVNIERNKSLKALNTFGVEARAAVYVAVRSTEDILEALSQTRIAPTPVLMLGGGSNLLLTGDIDGWVIHLCNKGITVVHEGDETCTVRVAAGEVWDDFIGFCLGRNLYGVENLVAIPGSVGAAPVQNIGAYGMEVKETITEVEMVMLRNGELRTLDNAACAFGYRTSIFKTKLKGEAVITSVTFTLKKKGILNLTYGGIKDALAAKGIVEPGLGDVADIIRSIRAVKLPDPKVTGNAGSFFRNPSVPAQLFADLQDQHPEIPSYPQSDGTIKLAAGWLIEQCGLKGYRLGNAAVHDRQSLVLVNCGNATGQDILALAHHIIEKVEQKFRIRLDPEVNIL